MLAEREPETWPLPPPAAACAEVFGSDGPEYASKYYRARYYDPKVGRFASQDPIGFDGGVNFYSYVLNNPATFADPFGLDVQVCRRPMTGKPDVPHTVVTSTNTGLGYGFGPMSPVPSPWIVWFPTPGAVFTEYPYDRFGKPKPEYQCQTASKKKCTEECILQYAAGQQSYPPAYYLGHFQCNDWTDEAVRFCKAKCGE